MKKILIVEDDYGIRDSLKDIMEFSGYDVRTAANGKDGFNEILESKPDLVICDINMPELNGYELLGSLNQRMSAELLPVFIFLSAKVENSDIRNGLNLGADDYITKPFDHNELLGIVKMRLERRQKLGASNHSFSQLSNESITAITSHKLAIPSNEGLDLIDFDLIIRCEADRAYCNFYIKNRSKIVVSKSLKEFETILLNKNFIKIHKSHIVNVRHIEKYIRGVNGYIVMSDGTSVPVSTRKKEEVLNCLRHI